MQEFSQPGRNRSDLELVRGTAPRGALASACRRGAGSAPGGNGRPLGPGRLAGRAAATQVVAGGFNRLATCCRRQADVLLRGDPHTPASAGSMPLANNTPTQRPMMISYRKAVILLADDDPGDQQLTRRALEQDAAGTNLRIVQNGTESLDYLYHRGRYADAHAAPEPDLILLDLNKPRLGGLQVLERLSAHPTASRIPKVVLTRCYQDDDILRCYALGCNSFVSKPVEMGALVDVIKGLRHSWFELVQLPTGLGR